VHEDARAVGEQHVDLRAVALAGERRDAERRVRDQLA